jgi:hypothetical protein
MTDRVFDIVVFRRGGRLDWRRANEVLLHDAQTELLIRGSRMEILGYYPNTTIEQRIAIMRAIREIAIMRAIREAERKNPMNEPTTTKQMLIDAGAP